MHDMKITAGLGALENLPRLAAAGADEVFCGYVPISWLEKYGNFTPLNRREVLLQGLQIDSLSDLKLLRRMADDSGVEVALTFNALYYLPEQLPLLCNLFGELKQIGLDRWILADPALMLHLKQNRIGGHIHLSGEAGCFSPDALTFFSRLGVERCIFPRKMTPEEMAACIATAPGLECEAFALNENCHFSGAHCLSLHCDELEALCRVPYRAVGPDYTAPGEPASPAEDGFGASGCSLCALPRLRRAGVTHLKVVGRGSHIDWIERDVRMLRRALDMDGTAPEELRRELLGNRCSGACYYPAPGR
ncbi:MAG: peptidase U32 family protein [Aristaeellaceae bacterium]